MPIMYFQQNFLEPKQGLGNNQAAFLAMGLSSDTKPDLSPESSIFIETDTGNIYGYSSSGWELKNSSSGGSSGSGNAYFPQGWN